MRPYLFAVCFFAFVSPFRVSAQHFQQDYLPLRDKGPHKTYTDTILNRFPVIEAVIKETDKDMRKAILEMNKENREYYRDLGNEYLLYVHDTITSYLQSIVNEITCKNPSWQFGKILVNTRRTDEPNAADIGNGVVLFNLNLLTFLDNEGELAFILGHEISHDGLKHILKGLRKQHEILTNKDFKNKISKAEKEEYNSLARLEQLYYSYLSKFLKNSRANELEADATSISLVDKTIYDPTQATSALQKLDSLEFYFLNFHIDYAKKFNFSGLPFKLSWLEFDDGTNFPTRNFRDTIPDSLKSHPDCEIRIATAKSIITINKLRERPRVNQQTFEYMKELAMFEVVEYYIAQEEYGRGLYYTIHMLDKYPNNSYLKISMGVFLAELQRALIDHRFTRVVDRESNYYPEAYNYFIKFLNNLTASAYRDITYNYMKDYLSGLPSSEYLDYCYTLFNTNTKSEKEKLENLRKFGELYQNTYYYKILQTRLKKNDLKN